MRTIFKVLITLMIIVILYILLYRCRVYVNPEHWSFETQDNEIKITVSNSYSLSNWGHSYERKGNDLYIKIYRFSYFNPFVNYRGYVYSFCIPENVSEIQRIYTYDLDGNMVLIKNYERRKFLIIIIIYIKKERKIFKIFLSFLLSYYHKIDKISSLQFDL